MALPTPRRVFILGGARSGKSTFAERLAGEIGGPVVYVATATAGDAEMAERIAMHRSRRPPGWRTLESPRFPSRALGEDGVPGSTILLEDLTLLLLAHAGRGAPGGAAMARAAVARAEGEVCAEIDALYGLPASVLLVSNEVGLGIVPGTPLGRAFRDALGRVNQHAAARCDEAYLLVAGIPLRLKGAASAPGAGPGRTDG